MRIFGTLKKDYYDTAIAYGVDTSIVYLRDTHENFDKPEPKYHEKIPNGSNRYFPKLKVNFERESGFIGFCGVLYPFVAVKITPEGETGKVPSVFFYAFADYLEYLATHGIKYEERTFRYGTTLKEFLSTPTTSDELFLKYKAPVLAITRNWLIENPKLESFEFYKVKHPVQAFQDISNYLGNQLVERKEILQIADKYLIENHGFDKTSFRHPIKLKDLK